MRHSWLTKLGVLCLNQLVSVDYPGIRADCMGFTNRVLLENTIYILIALSLSTAVTEA